MIYHIHMSYQIIGHFLRYSNLMSSEIKISLCGSHSNLKNTGAKDKESSILLPYRNTHSMMYCNRNKFDRTAQRRDTQNWIHTNKFYCVISEESFWKTFWCERNWVRFNEESVYKDKDESEQMRGDKERCTKCEYISNRQYRDKK